MNGYGIEIESIEKEKCELRSEIEIWKGGIDEKVIEGRIEKKEKIVRKIGKMDEREGIIRYRMRKF